MRKPSLHNVLTILGAAWFGKQKKVLMLNMHSEKD